ncbi:MAG: hypothetical protein HY816_15620 [Candidatus Wallbacteria bacterium]|nr:hypothetical protein [Candidatus Wallbacteria bacterium]
MPCELCAFVEEVVVIPVSRNCARRFTALLTLAVCGLWLSGCGDVQVLGTPPSVGAAPPAASLIAGGTSGDGASPLAASLEAPHAIAIGAGGAIYVAELSRVRRIDAPQASTLAGTGPDGTASSPAGVAAASDGTVFVTDSDSAGLYSLSPGSSVLRRLNAEPDRVLASFEDGIPIGSAALGAPGRLRIDAAQNLLLSDPGTQRLRIIERTADPDPDRALRIRTVAGTRNTTGFAGDGLPASQAALCTPRGVGVDASGNLLFADSGNHRIRRVSASAGTLATAAGTGSACGSAGGFDGEGFAADATRLDGPSDVAGAPGGRILIADTGNRRIRAIEPATRLLATVAGDGGFDFAGDGLPAAQSSIGRPLAVAALPDGSYLIADRRNHRVRRVAPDGTISTLAGAGTGGGTSLAAARFSRITALAVDGGNRLLIADGGWVLRSAFPAGTTTRVAGDGRGGYSGDGAGATAARIRPAAGLALDAAGNLFLSDDEAHVVRRVDALTGRITTVAGTPATTAFTGDGGPANAAGLFRPRGLATDSRGNLFIADSGHHAVRVVDRFGVIFTLANVSGTAGSGGDGGDARNARLNAPSDVAVDPRQGNVLIADTGNGAVRVVRRDGSSLDGTIATSGSFFGLLSPAQVDVDPSGNVAVLDSALPAVLLLPAGATASRALDLGSTLSADFSDPQQPPDFSLALSLNRRALVSDGKRIAQVGY